jgi:predicted kinase
MWAGTAMATVHLICGPTGAGKTTYAQALSDRLRGVRFSIEVWMANLFMADRPEPMRLDWAVQRTARCETQMWALADGLLPIGIDVVFDVGLSTREHRDRFRLRSARLGAECKLHYLDVDAETRRMRVRQRNAQRDGTSAFEVTDSMFEWMERRFEPPTDDELYEGMIVCS